MSDDLVKRLCDRRVCSPAQNSCRNDWVINQAADRIEQLVATNEELEAKLRKAVGALGDISNGEPEWPDDPQKELDWCRNRATTALAELKGQDDGQAPHAG